VIIAIDHGNYAGAMKGIENPRGAVEAAVRGGADAVIVNIGTLRKVYRDLAGRVGIILRLDGGHTLLHPDKTPSSTLTTTVAEAATKAGGAGVAFGRNVWQSNNPIGMVKALVRIVHEGKSAPEASLQLRDTR